MPVLDGAMISTDGAVHNTVNVSLAVLPPGSLAVTVITFSPDQSLTPLALHEVVPEHTPDPPRLHDQATLAIPNAWSALPPMLMASSSIVYVSSDVGSVISMVGGSVPVDVIVMVSLSVFPVRSVAVTVITFSPNDSSMPDALHDVVPVQVPDAPWSLDQATSTTSTSSDADPEIVTMD